MQMTHVIPIDMRNPGTPTRISVKQGDAMTHIVVLRLLDNDDPWQVPTHASPVIRWFACDPSSGETARGLYDTLPDGTSAWGAEANQLTVRTVPQMFAMPGIVQADVAFVYGENVRTTFNFEFYVHPAPVNGTEPEVQDYYKVATLDQINAFVTDTTLWRGETDQHITHILQEVKNLKEKLAGK